jgi:uncharacterized RDD family membrane protein YckC
MPTATPVGGQLALASPPDPATPVGRPLALVSLPMEDELAALFEVPAAEWEAEVSAGRWPSNAAGPEVDFSFLPAGAAPPGFELGAFDAEASEAEPGGQVIVGPWADRPVAVRHASWRQRVLAALIDGAVFLPALVATALSVTVGGLLLGAAIAFTVWQLCFRQGRTGQSVGKHLLRLFVVREDRLTPIGPRRATLRLLAHGIDAALLGVGFLWPLWDAKRQTFADQLLGTIVAVG